MAKGTAGWLHRLSDAPKQVWREVKRTPPKPYVDFGSIARKHYRAMTTDKAWWLMERLKVAIEPLQALRVGWNSEWNCYSFPMREANGYINGLRYRRLDDSKLSEKHSREGLFFQPATLTDDYLVITEGASDCLSLMNLGFMSVIGRTNCRANVEQIESLVRRLRPQRIIIVPDSDTVGLAGAEELRANLRTAELFQLPGSKDVRQFVSETKNAEWLRDQLGKLIETPLTGVTHR